MVTTEYGTSFLQKKYTTYNKSQKFAQNVQKIKDLDFS